MANAEGGSIYAIDPSAGYVHVFTYRGYGLGVGPLPAGLAVTAEVGAMSQTTIGTFSGRGFSVNAIAAAKAGETVQVFGNAKDMSGFTVGPAAGIAAGISGLVVTTSYQGSLRVYENQISR